MLKNTFWHQKCMLVITSLKQITLGFLDASLTKKMISSKKFMGMDLKRFGKNLGYFFGIHRYLSVKIIIVIIRNLFVEICYI